MSKRSATIRADSNEQALRDAMQRLENAQKVARLGDWSHDFASAEVTWSPQVFELLERDPVAGTLSFEESLHYFGPDGAEAIRQAMRQAIATGQAQRYELRALLPSRSLVHFFVNAIPHRDGSGRITGLRGTIQDITEHKLMAARLSEAKETADAASRAKSAFLATMSHEIRTPIHGILGMLELLSLTPLRPDQRSALEVVRESGNSLQRIIDDILDFSKIEAGKLDINPEATSIQRVVEAVHRIYSGSATGAGLALKSSCDPGISPAVLVDGLRVRQILSNFVSNALKFTPQGQVEIRAELIERVQDRERIRFTVQDTGIGISPDHQQRLFEPFAQAESNIATRFGGTGLGLAICRRLAEMMGGAIRMASEPGHGTTMTLILPVTILDPASLTSPGDGALAPNWQAHTLHRKPPGTEQAREEGSLVLVVDDHPINRMVLESQLNTLGYAVETADDGLEALDLWRHGRYGLIITDCNMPTMSGYELSRAIREAETADDRSRIPIIACTANALSGEAQNCLDAGMDDYIAKPTGLMPLLAKINRWLPLAGDAAARARTATGESDAASAAEPEPAANRDPIDGATLQGLTRGDAAAVGRILGHFRRVNDEDVPHLLQAVTSQDLALVVRKAHRIKGASKFVGASDFAAVCARIEQAGRDDDPAAVDEQMPHFHRELERLNAYLDSV